VSALGEWAAKVAEAAERLESTGAIDICEEQAKDFVAIERIVTPKRTGALADSERIDSISGGGASAHATVSPHKIYAAFRENGGTIHAHAGLGRMGLRPHTLHWDGGPFPLSVSQRGAHYVEKAEGAAASVLTGTAEEVMAEILDGI
jgi:hypothetical protein